MVNHNYCLLRETCSVLLPTFMYFREAKCFCIHYTQNVLAHLNTWNPNIAIHSGIHFVTLLRMYHAHHCHTKYYTLPSARQLLFQHTFWAGGLMVGSVHLKYTHSWSPDVCPLSNLHNFLCHGSWNCVGNVPMSSIVAN